MLIEKIKQYVNNDLQGAEELFYKTANIYRRPDGFYFIPQLTSTHGGIVPCSPIIKRNIGSRLSSLGESLLSCLLHTENKVEKSQPPETLSGKRGLMQIVDSKIVETNAVNTPVHGGFHASALAVLVQCYVGRVVFHPMTKKGSQNNYYGNPEAIFEVSTDLSVNELGKALRTSFSLAES